MEYSYFPQTQAYDFYTLPHKPLHPYTPQEDFINDPIDSYADPTAFAAFDNQTFQFQPNPLIHPNQPQSPPPSLHDHSRTQALSTETSNDTPILDGEGFDQPMGGRSSDEDKELTPAQNRRKAQNRAAQRAFRERKERHVRDLEIKLSSLSATNTQILSEKDRLAREVERLATQNEILRATTSTIPPPYHPSAAPIREPSPIPGPQSYSPSSFQAALASGHGSAAAGREITHRIVFSEGTGERLLGTGATWDMIQSHEEYRAGRVDLGSVCERLKDVAVCDGLGPAYRESAIRRAIEESVGGPGDELI